MIRPTKPLEQQERRRQEKHQVRALVTPTSTSSSSARLSPPPHLQGSAAVYMHHDGGGPACLPTNTIAFSSNRRYEGRHRLRRRLRLRLRRRRAHRVSSTPPPPTRTTTTYHQSQECHNNNNNNNNNHNHHQNNKHYYDVVIIAAGGSKHSNNMPQIEGCWRQGDHHDCGSQQQRKRRNNEHRTTAAVSSFSLMMAKMIPLLPYFAIVLCSSLGRCWAWNLHPPILPTRTNRRLQHHYHRHHHPYMKTIAGRRSTAVVVLHAKRNKNKQREDMDDLNYWYENVDDSNEPSDSTAAGGAAVADGTGATSTTPDDAFWEEMERQRWASASASASSGEGGGSGPSPTSSGLEGGAVDSSVASVSSSSSSSATAWGSGPTLSRTSDAIGLAAMNNPASSISGGSPGVGGVASRQQQAMSLKSAEATLSEYAAYAVSDNWLDEELVWMMSDDQIYHDDEDSQDYKGRTLEDQLEEWEHEQEKAEEGLIDDEAWMSSDEPWDQWGERKADEGRNDHERDLVMTFDPKTRTRARDYLLDDEEEDDDESKVDNEEELKRQEAEFLEKISKIAISSRRLERARNSPKAKAFFSNKQPNAVEGYDRLWVSAIDNACFKNLKGSFRNYGIEFADNFGDWVDGNIEDGLHYSVEEIASFKARQVYDVTGLPCIACRTSFEIEPIPNLNTGAGVGSGGAAATSSSSQASPPGVNNPRVASGYRFNDIGMHVEYVCDALRPLSEPSRVTQFKTCLCYYDGSIEVFDYGVAEVDLVFANSLRTFIPVSQAINEMIKTLELTFGLQYQPWLQKRVDETRMAGIGPASMKLRDRVLKEGRILPNDIIDVSAFMDARVDVNLMDECARELSNRFVDEKPTKILTVATTGLVIALPMAKYLQVPLVYARKERNIVMADTYKAAYSSKTVGKNRELLVSKSHLDPDDRVLVIDDFLSSGSSQEALLRVIAESGAEAIGIGVLLEKVYDSGRQSLSGFNVPTHSLCRVASVKNGVIQLVEEEGYDMM